MMRVVRQVLLAAACLLALSCRRTPPQAASSPPAPAPAPAPIVVPRKEAPKKDVNLPAAPPIASKVPSSAPPTVETKPPTILPPAPPKKQRRPKIARKAPEVPKPAPVKPAQPEEVKVAEAKPEAPQTAPAPAPEAAGTPPAATAQTPASPKLGQMLTPAESKEYQKRLDTTVDRVRGAVSAIQAKPLSDDQKEIVGRIRSFLAQAEQAREQDLVSAVNLAERADLLSRDLLERLR